MGNSTIEMRELGKSGVIVPAMGVGAMVWTSSKKEDEFLKAYRAALDGGMNFFDTAEIYGLGESERILGRCMKKDGRPAIIASKFAPPSKMMPARKRKTVQKNSPDALMEALDGSLYRLGVDCMDLYQMHMPPSKNSIADYMAVMAKAVKAGKVRAVGVVNFSAEQLREAHAALAEYGIPLATTMVGYNILRRWPETNGVFDACKELDVTLIPYAPLAEGLLTGKYRESKMPFMYKAALYFSTLNVAERSDSASRMSLAFSRPRELDNARIEPLFRVLDEIASSHGKTIVQVAINWLVTNPDINVVPIPGMRNVRQVEGNLGTLGWQLSADERTAIDREERKSRT